MDMSGRVVPTGGNYMNVTAIISVILILLAAIGLVYTRIIIYRTNKMLK
jgi:hypothetical protein